MKNLAIALSILFLGYAAFPQESIKLGGLKDAVTIRRDARSIPYIQAANDTDLYFAQGYATASDRLFQMDLMRRLARGETAEIFGKITLEEDKRWRRFGFAQVSEENLALLPNDLRAALESYAKGVNAFIASMDAVTTPIEFKILQYRPREWRPTDTIVIGKVLSDALSTTWRHDLLRASLQNLPKDKLADLTNQVTPYDVVLFGSDLPASNAGGSSLGSYADMPPSHASNNWVISGKRTADGKPLLANDPHLLPTAPGIWYLTHLSTPTMRVSGVTFPGVPGIVLGHNEQIAWGATNVGPDVQDLYIETFNEKGEYKTPTGWQKPIIRRETINVRTSALKTTTEPVTLDVTVTRNGPIIFEEAGKRYALKWTAFDPKNSEFEAFYRFNRAKDWKAFTAALRNYGGAAQNFVYADVKGNIGWYAASKIPIRRTGDGAWPYDGATNDGDWVGMIPFNELPHLYNPPSGLIVTANQRIVGTSYKYKQMSRDAASPWRARRIFDLLNTKTKITMDDVRDVQHDTLNIPLLNLAKEYAKVGMNMQDTTIMMRKWDGRMIADSQAALMANEIMGCVANKMANDHEGLPANIVRERIVDWALREKPARWLPSEFKDYGELLTFCEARRSLDLNNSPLYESGNPQTWVWGRTWQSRFPHPLAAAPLIGEMFATPSVPLDGSGQTPNVGSYVSMRHIATPGNWDATRQVIPLGQSGNPNSPHFRDQFDKWRSGEIAVFPFSKTAVEKASAAVVTLMAK